MIYGLDEYYPPTLRTFTKVRERRTIAIERNVASQQEKIEEDFERLKVAPRLVLGIAGKHME